MVFVIQSEIYIFWALLGLITPNFSLCKWDVNSSSKLLLLLEKEREAGDFWSTSSPEQQNCSLEMLLFFIENRGEARQLICRKLRDAWRLSVSWGSILGSLCWKKWGTGFKDEETMMSPTGVRQGCATHSLQARFCPAEPSILLQLFSCQPAARRKIMCCVTKMPAPLLTFTLWIVCQS